jgi:uncharacterized membrane protein
MWNNGYNYIYPNAVASNFLAGFSFLLVPLLVWSLFWKGWALWLAARNGSKPWFIALLIVNTVGILDIIYIFAFGKKAAKKGRK